MKTLSSTKDDVLKRLGDTAELIWSSAEIERYLQNGYNVMALETHCFWRQTYLEDRETTGNYTADFEKDWFSAGEISYNRFAYCAPDDVNWADPGDLDYGPTNHTAKWEVAWLSVGDTPDPTYYTTVETLPRDLYDIERATWNFFRIEPLRSTELEYNDARYQVNRGEVLGYTRDKDGLNRFRKWRAPAVAADSYTISNPCSGILRNPADISGEPVTGKWGIPRRIPTQPASAGTWWGFPRRPFRDGHNTKIEYFNRGRQLSDRQGFEIPDRYVKYIRHYAIWKALERNGVGQDPILAEHWKGRWKDGISRMIRRRKAMLDNRFRVLGDTLLPFGPPPRPKYPWNYGEVVR